VRTAARPCSSGSAGSRSAGDVWRPRCRHVSQAFDHQSRGAQAPARFGSPSAGSHAVHARVARLRQAHQWAPGCAGTPRMQTCLLAAAATAASRCGTRGSRGRRSASPRTATRRAGRAPPRPCVTMLACVERARAVLIVMMCMRGCSSRPTLPRNAPSVSSCRNVPSVAEPQPCSSARSASRHVPAMLPAWLRLHHASCMPPALWPPAETSQRCGGARAGAGADRGLVQVQRLRHRNGQRGQVAEGLGRARARARAHHAAGAHVRSPAAAPCATELPV
jgi:hypothetical protein